ncbi:hypothetical protein B0T09DRAFT_318515 [Sordaria sp. MPI-SDFR-AT-0083]|nr:hypothetical protein B0T09DRAFT_318515 [Sordaria sp. MPI-SDFR-AT-0083]
MSRFAALRYLLKSLLSPGSPCLKPCKTIGPPIANSPQLQATDESFGETFGFHHDHDNIGSVNRARHSTSAQRQNVLCSIIAIASRELPPSPPAFGFSLKMVKERRVGPISQAQGAVLGSALREFTEHRDVKVESQFTGKIQPQLPKHLKGKEQTLVGPPNDEVVKAWKDLHIDIVVIKIPKEDAQRLPNQTLLTPGEKDGYIVGNRDMTDQQCKKYWIYLEHCTNNLRQAIMCYSDISTIP